MKSIKNLTKVMYTILALAVFIAAVPLSVSAAVIGPYGAPDLTFEDYLDWVEKNEDLDEFILDSKEWDGLVAYTYKYETEITLVNKEGIIEIDWMLYGNAVRDMRFQNDLDGWYDWYSSLPYDEQMRILYEDAAVHDQMGKDAEAAAAAQASAEAAKPITLKVNGSVVPTDSPPVIENGRTLAPLRAVVESLGYIATWDSSTQTVGIYDVFTEDLIIEMTIGKNIARVSVGSSENYIFDDRYLEVPPKLIKGRTMVPVRFIAETLGCKVNWDQATRTVSITKDAG